MVLSRVGQPPGRSVTRSIAVIVASVAFKLRSWFADALIVKSPVWRFAIHPVLPRDTKADAEALNAHLVLQTVYWISWKWLSKVGAVREFVCFGARHFSLGVRVQGELLCKLGVACIQS